MLALIVEYTSSHQFNPHLYHDPSIQKLREYEASHGIVSMGE
jgi:hypothetical protein